MNQILQSARRFLRDEEGAQVVEYALIIAIISVGLVLAFDGLNGNFATFVGKVGTCLTGGSTACAAAFP